MNKQISDLWTMRSRFPALQEKDDQGRTYVYFDGPGGTQVPGEVAHAMAEYFRLANANHGGCFVTSRRNDEMIQRARVAMADFLNAPSPDEIVFGANMTTLTFNLSRVIGRHLSPGDEIIVTHLDHDANISPWLALEEKGVIVKWAKFDIRDCRLDLGQLSSLITDKTKLIAVGYASNAVGTINPVKRIAEMAHASGAWLWVDAVHYAPHGPIDVQEIGCDFLACSAYKFFGPHVGVLYGRMALLEALDAYKVRPAGPVPPEKFEWGTLNHEGLAGIIATVDYLAGLAAEFEMPTGVVGPADPERFDGRRKMLKKAMNLVTSYERGLFGYMVSELENISGITLYGITNPEQFDERCPTLAFTLAGSSPEEIAARLGEQGVFVWNGNYYALAVTQRLGVEDSGGMVRVGLTHYNTKTEVDRLVAAVKEMVPD